MGKPLTEELTGIYSALSGLWGVVVTDFFQFVFAMSGTIALAWFVLQLPAIGGLSGLVAQSPPGMLDFVPSFEGASNVTLVALPLDRQRALDATLDDVRDRFGSEAITRAVLIGRDPGWTPPLLPD